MPAKISNMLKFIITFKKQWMDITDITRKKLFLFRAIPILSASPGNVAATGNFIRVCKAKLGSPATQEHTSTATLQFHKRNFSTGVLKCYQKSEPCKQILTASQVTWLSSELPEGDWRCGMHGRLLPGTGMLHLGAGLCPHWESTEAGPSTWTSALMGFGCCSHRGVNQQVKISLLVPISL